MKGGEFVEIQEHKAADRAGEWVGLLARERGRAGGKEGHRPKAVASRSTQRLERN